MKCNACGSDTLSPHAKWDGSGHVDGFLRCDACGNVQKPETAAPPVADAAAETEATSEMPTSAPPQQAEAPAGDEPKKARGRRAE